MVVQATRGRIWINKAAYVSRDIVQGLSPTEVDQTNRVQSFHKEKL